MIGSTNNKFKIFAFINVIVLVLLLSTLIIIILNLKIEKKKEENYYYNYYINNEEDLNNLVNFSINNDIYYIGKKECIICVDYKQKEINNIYFYTNKMIDETVIDTHANFVKKSVLKEVYLTSSGNYYILLLEQNNTKTVFLEYCKNDCNYTEANKKEKNGNKTKYYIRKKINENWILIYTSIE